MKNNKTNEINKTRIKTTNKIVFLPGSRSPTTGLVLHPFIDPVRSVIENDNCELYRNNRSPIDETDLVATNKLLSSATSADFKENPEYKRESKESDCAIGSLRENYKTCTEFDSGMNIFIDN